MSVWKSFRAAEAASSTTAASSNASLADEVASSTAASSCDLPVERAGRGSAKGHGKAQDRCKGKSMGLQGKAYNAKGSHASSGKGFVKGASRSDRREVHVFGEADSQELAEGVSLRGALLGRGGENFEHIRAETGVRLWLSGRGSGRETDGPGPEDKGPLRVVLASSQREALDRATELCQDLVRSVREQQQQRREHQASSNRDEGKGRGNEANGKGKGKGSSVSQALKDEQDRMKKEMEEAKLRAERLRREAEAKRRAVKEKTQELSELLKQEVETEDVLKARRAAVDAGKKALLERGKEGEGATDDAAVTALQSAQAFWDALDRSRAAAEKPDAMEARKAMVAARDEARQAAASALTWERTAKQLKQTSAMLTVPVHGTTARCCALYANRSCPFPAAQCPRGSHQQPEAPAESDVFQKITRAKLRLVQQRWSDAGGRGQLVNAWQIRNPRLEFLFRGAEANFTELYGHLSDAIDAWHGSREENILSIAVNGFDPERRCGQAYGAGEYFAKDPNVSIGYAAGGSFMFLCKLLLGKPEVDHTWVSGPRYYVIKQREGQALFQNMNYDGY
jgi:hypothetical protein